jgi:ATP adenylyltransferase
MMFEYIWNGWRASYLSSQSTPKVTGNGSIFTQILNSGMTDEEAHIVHRGEHVFAILNAYPYTVGHILILPFREESELEELTVEETAELWAATTNAVKALKATYPLDGLNVGINLGRPAGGSVSEHLHVHVVPRWTGDANFMTTVANTRSMSESLDVTAAKVRSAWPAA